MEERLGILASVGDTLIPFIVLGVVLVAAVVLIISFILMRRR